MSFVTKNRIKNWLLIFLLVTNVATILTIFYHRWNFRRHMHKENSFQNFKEFIKNDLGLSEEQKAKIDKERKATDSTRKAYYYKMENMRIAIYSQFVLANPDSTVIDSLVGNMSSLYSDINYLGISHNLYMLNICTDEQKTRLQKKYGEMVSEMKEEQIADKNKKENDND